MITTQEIEVYLARVNDIRRNVIVSNVSWGLNIHECDMLIMTRSGYLTEIEIKISLSDLKKDKQKSHGHISNKIKKLYFALPIKIANKHYSHIPLRAGIIAIYEDDGVIRSEILCNPQINNNARKLSECEMYDLARLGSMRVWSAKNKYNKILKINKDLKNKIKEMEK